MNDQEKERREQIDKSGWMKAKGLPMVAYDKLKPHNKILLWKIICLGELGSYKQRSDLLIDLGLQEGRGGALELPTDESTKEFFSSDDVPYLKKF